MASTSNPFAVPNSFRSSGSGSIDYPTSARDTLIRVETMILGKKQDLCFELIAEFVFLEKTGRSNAVNSLSLIQEYQLVVVLCEFFTRSGTEIVKNAVFLSLFSAVTPFVSRSKVLAKLISTAVSGSIIPVLRASGTWMQQMGPISVACLGVAQRLIDDFINYARTCPEALKTLPLLAPRFTINFMTSATELYLMDTSKSTYPPPMLLDVLTNWMTQHPTLCLSTQPPLALPPGAIPMQMVTPLAGMIRWCVLAPMHQDKTIESEKFSQLHLSILQCLSQVPSTSPTLSVINAIHLSTTLMTLQRSVAPSEALQTSLERLALVIQLALTAQTITGNIDQLIGRLENLPPNPLMQIVIKSHKS